MIINEENKGKKVSIKDCFYCACHDDKVEAGGMWHCPNPRCGGPGVAWFNRKLKSYKDLGGSYTIDEAERRYATGLYLSSPEIFNKVYGVE